MPRNKRAAVPPETLDQLRKRFAALPPAPPSSLTARQIVHQLRGEIEHARSLGYTFDQIASQLNSGGVPLAPSTLRNYTSLPPPRQRGKYKPPPNARKAPAPPKVKAAASAASPPPASSPAAAPAAPEAKRTSSTTYTLKRDRIKS